MGILSSFLFYLPYNLFGREEMKFYKSFVEDYNKPAELLFEEQNAQLRKLIAHAYCNIPFYKNKFKSLGILPSDINTINDLSILPVLTKQEIRENYDLFLPEKPFPNFVIDSTGGSTGVPLKYRVSRECYSRGVALLYRGWGIGGYKPGDRVLIIAGASLVSKKPTLKNRIIKYSRNYKSLSSYGIDEMMSLRYLEIIKKWKPKFLRGYASSLYLLSKFADENGGIKKLGISPPKAIFSTAEMLTAVQRNFIEFVFKTKIFNQYGLNDGGISAYENGNVDSFLIDTERSVMECVDQNGKMLFDQPGSLLATSLYNFDFPFIRYDTGDMGKVSDILIKDGGNRYVLKELMGRATDSLNINGKIIGSPVLTVLMGKVDALRYQVIQTSDQSIELRIEKGPSFNDESIKFIKESFNVHLGDIDLTFKFGTDFLESGNKHKFIFKK